MSSTDWSAWKQLAARYPEKRPRRMLSLDDGGIRGVIMAKVLLRIEAMTIIIFLVGHQLRIAALDAISEDYVCDVCRGNSCPI